MSDGDFFRGLVWLGMAWGMGIAAWLWDARRTFVDREDGRGVIAVQPDRAGGQNEDLKCLGADQGNASRQPCRPLSNATSPGRPSSRFANGGDDAPDSVKPATTEVHPADATTGPGVQAGARPASGGRRC